MDRLIERLASTFSAGYCTDNDLCLFLRDYGNPFNVTGRLVRDGVLIRLKRGFFVFGMRHSLPRYHPFVIANHLYGPSYVSLESALSFYGLIPEGVRETTSIALTKPKRFTTSVGRFSYRTIRSDAFANGVISQQDSSHRYLLAEQEKALLDKLYLDGGNYPYYDYLTESLRIEATDLARINRSALSHFASHYTQAFSRRVAGLIETFDKRL